MRAGDLEWSCWTTAARIAHDLTAYAGQLVGPGHAQIACRSIWSPRTVRARLISCSIVAACGAILASYCACGRRPGAWLALGSDRPLGLRGAGRQRDARPHLGHRPRSGRAAAAARAVGRSGPSASCFPMPAGRAAGRGAVAGARAASPSAIGHAASNGVASGPPSSRRGSADLLRWPGVERAACHLRFGPAAQPTLWSMRCLRRCDTHDLWSVSRRVRSHALAMGLLAFRTREKLRAFLWHRAARAPANRLA